MASSGQSPLGSVWQRFFPVVWVSKCASLCARRKSRQQTSPACEITYPRVPVLTMVALSERRPASALGLVGRTHAATFTSAIQSTTQRAGGLAGNHCSSILEGNTDTLSIPTDRAHPAIQSLRARRTVAAKQCNDGAAMKTENHSGPAIVLSLLPEVAGGLLQLAQDGVVEMQVHPLQSTISMEESPSRPTAMEFL